MNKIPKNEGEIIKSKKPNYLEYAGKIDLDIFRYKIIDYYIGKQSGIFVILPEGQRILEVFKSIINNKLIQKLQYNKLSLPKISPTETFKKANALKKWDDYLEKVLPYSKTKGIKEEYILEPLQCIPLYQYLENKSLNNILKIIDDSGPTYRNEDLDKIKPLVKQREFHRTELIYIGKKDEVINQRETILEIFEDLLNELNIAHRIVVGNECYKLSKNEIIIPKTLEEIQVKDIELFIPNGFRNNKNEPYLEVIGACILGNLQTKRFNITDNNKNYLWSGCVGIGQERLIYSFLANYGFDKNKWPKLIKNKYSELYGDGHEQYNL